MAVYRNNKRRFFAAVDVEIVRSNVLSLPALGLLVVLLDRPEWWEVYTVEIAHRLGVDEASLLPLFSELEAKGYVQARRGRRGAYYDVFERPPGKRASPQPAPVIPPEEPPAPQQELDWPDKPVPGQPMSDRNREYALQLIRERFPIVVKKHDLNEAIRSP